jgi:hypothetical protein
VPKTTLSGPLKLCEDAIFHKLGATESHKNRGQGRGLSLALWSPGARASRPAISARQTAAATFHQTFNISLS